MSGDATISHAPAISSTRIVLDHGLSQRGASHYFVSQLLGTHPQAECDTTPQRPGTVPLVTDDTSVTNVVEGLVRNLKSSHQTEMGKYVIDFYFEGVSDAIAHYSLGGLPRPRRPPWVPKHVGKARGPS